MITYRHASRVQNHKCRRQTASWFVLRRDPCQRHEGEELGRPECSHWDQLLCPYDEWSRETVHLIQVWVEWLRKLTSQLTGPKSRESKTEKAFFFLVGKSIRVLPDCTELWLVGILSRWFYHTPDTMIFQILLECWPSYLDIDTMCYIFVIVTLIGPPFCHTLYYGQYWFFCV